MRASTPNSPWIEHRELDEPSTFFANVTQKDATMITNELANRAFSHSLTAMDTEPVESYNSASVRYNSEEFYGIMIDTGAAHLSTAGYGQFQALKRFTGPTATLDKSREGEATVRYGIGTTSSLGPAIINSPIGKIEFHIMDADVPFLLCLADMNRMRVKLDNLTNVLNTPRGDIPVMPRLGH